MAEDFKMMSRMEKRLIKNNRKIERIFEKNIITPFQHFVSSQVNSGMLLLAAAILALMAVNWGWAQAYHDLGHVKFSIGLGDFKLEKSIHHWMNDGLMALFFFVVGLELKREFMVGELSQPKQAMLPIFAAIGGMVVPALIYFAMNPSGPATRGWGIVMATDIAFALGTIALLAGRVPQSLIAFLVALAIVDDLGAVLVIAIFYTADLNFQYLYLAAYATMGLIFLNFLGVRGATAYFIFGVILWFFLLKSGVHATLAGVIAAFCVPAAPKYDPFRFAELTKEQLDGFEESYKKNPHIMTNTEMRGIIGSIEAGARNVQTPLQKFESTVHYPVAFLILPLFAFLNAGIYIDFANLGTEIMKPVTLSIIFGLFFGKMIGISLFSWIALKMGVASLPKGANFAQIVGAAILGGIGFTMSIFVTELAFPAHEELAIQAKMGILIASIMSGVIGYLVLLMVSPAPQSKDK